jgi:hypothetical protein
VVVYWTEIQITGELGANLNEKFRPVGDQMVSMLARTRVDSNFQKIYYLQQNGGQSFVQTPAPVTIKM